MENPRKINVQSIKNRFGFADVSHVVTVWSKYYDDKRGFDNNRFCFNRYELFIYRGSHRIRKDSAGNIFRRRTFQILIAIVNIKRHTCKFCASGFYIRTIAILIFSSNAEPMPNRSLLYRIGFASRGIHKRFEGRLFNRGRIPVWFDTVFFSQMCWKYYCDKSGGGCRFR